MSLVVSAIKVFGYLERPVSQIVSAKYGPSSSEADVLHHSQVFHELARHLQTRRLLAGETLSLDSADFYVVVDGTMQVYAHIKGTHPERLFAFV